MSCYLSKVSVSPHEVWALRFPRGGGTLCLVASCLCHRLTSSQCRLAAFLGFILPF